MSVRYLLMFERDVPKAVSFFKHGIGASLKVMTEQWAELQAGDTILALKSAPGYVVVVVVVLFLLLLLVTIVPFRLFLSVSLSLCLFLPLPFFFHHKMKPKTSLNCRREAQCSTGYSPMVVFNVDDVQERLTKIISMGGRMDGSVQYTLQGSKIAVVKSPSGQTIGLIGG